MSRTAKKRKNVTTTPVYCTACPTTRTTRIFVHKGVVGKPHRACGGKGNWARKGSDS